MLFYFLFLLRNEAVQVKRQGLQCLISNHDLELTRELYSEAIIYELLVQRSIASRSESRQKIQRTNAVWDTIRKCVRMKFQALQTRRESYNTSTQPIVAKMKHL